MSHGEKGRAARITPKELHSRISGANKILLMLDYDGTLVPIAGTPACARPDGTILRLLGRLAARPGLALAVVSGRSPADLNELIKVPRVVRVAGHGAYIHWPGGVEELMNVPPAARDCMRQLFFLARRLTAGKRGFLIEDKKWGLALHYRLAGPSAAGQVLNEFCRSARHIIKSQGLEILRGKKVLEVRHSGADKGTAVKKLCRKFGGFFPVYLGDDVTDEDAFSVLRDSGAGVLVARSGRRTAARFRLAGGQEVRKFLSLIERGGTND